MEISISEAIPIPIPIQTPIQTPIPVDLFVSKKHPKSKHGDFRFVDSDGHTVYKVEHRSNSSPESSSGQRVLTDSAGSPLLSMLRHHNGSWQCFKEDSEGKEFVFEVQRTKHTLTRTELDVFLGGRTGRLEDSSPDLTVKGFPFQRSCTIYTGKDIVAQTSLMYKLNQIFVKRGKFRLTIFPGTIDHSWIVALVVMFLHG